MSKVDKLIDSVCDGFQNKRGRASMYCFKDTIIPHIVYAVIDRFHNKRPNDNIFICVDCYETRKRIMDFLNSKVDDAKKVYNINILSEDYVKTKYNYNYRFYITVGVNSNIELINHFCKNRIAFVFSIFTKLCDADFITNVRKILPTIDTPDFDVVISTDNLYSPVEEWRVPIVLTDDARAQYNKYSEYISTCVKIFGDLYNIEKCKKGDVKNNISAAEFRDALAKSNGWSENLNSDNAYEKQIDDIYNPNMLYERAMNFYTIAHNRRDFLNDYEGKLPAILSICEKHKDSKILIVSKRGEFAATITKYLNQHNISCGDYHDCIDAQYMKDEDDNIITYKSGANKGKPKLFGAISLSNQAQAAFNQGLIKVLSIKNASDTKLKTACDVVILTSCLHENIIDVKRRFTNVNVASKPNIVYRLYCSDTIENERLVQDVLPPNVTIMNDEENFATIDENSGDIVL